MKVIIKRASELPKICEVSGIAEINKLVGNVNQNGDGINHGGSDIRMAIGNDIDVYMKDDALFNSELEGNLWTVDDSAVICGTVVFAGYSRENKSEDGCCSLTQEQIDYCQQFIGRQSI